MEILGNFSRSICVTLDSMDRFKGPLVSLKNQLELSS